MSEHNKVSRMVKNFGEFRYYLVLEGIGVGIFAGLVVVLFRLVLGWMEQCLELLSAFAKGQAAILPLWFMGLGLAALAVTLLLRWEPMIAGSGIPQVEGEMQGFFHQKWWRVLTAKFIGGMVTIGCGLSLGREGPSIQLGAMAGKGFARMTRRQRMEERMLITCGASAGLAAAFNAPLAGVLFSLEELHKNFSVEVLLSSMASAITADFISRNVFGLRPVFDFSGAIAIPLSHFWIVMLLGIALGLLGTFYNKCIQVVQNWYEKIKNTYIKTLIPFLLAGIFTFAFPVVLGGGSGLIMQVSEQMPLKFLLLIFVVKYCFSLASFCAGVPGGIFLPLLVMGSLFGSIFHGAAAYMGMELNLKALIILGMAGSFAAIVRAPVTGILLITEMTGNFDHLLFLSLVSLTAFATADLLHAKPIYEQLLRRMMLKFGRPRFKVESGEKILLEIPVQLGAKICNHLVREVNLPDRCLIITVERGEEEIVPKGETILRTGDILIVLCDEFDSASVQYALEKQCRVLV